MLDSNDIEWDPFAPSAANDQTRRYDDLRNRCPVAHSSVLGWSVFRHGDVRRVLEDPATFSNVVSTHSSVPNGMDPPEHTEYRRIIDPYFAPERMLALEPHFRTIVNNLIARLPASGEFEVMGQLAEDFALQAQCAFLDWPADSHAPLREWVRKNHAATRSRDRTRIVAVAMEFDNHIRDVLASRRHQGRSGMHDIASHLLEETVQGRKLSDEEIVSILRNWTVGELATIAASVGILAHYLGHHPALQKQLRADASQLPAAIDEILRIDAPLMTSRRVVSRPAELGGRTFKSGERMTLMWASANRDEQVFGNPDEFRLDRDPSSNLLYGAGIHVCPGAPLARLELRVMMEELLRAADLSPSIESEPIRALYPAGGFASVHLRIHKRAA